MKKVQIKTTKKTCWRARPCLMTNAFCAPIATIRDNPVKNPGMKASTVGRLVEVTHLSGCKAKLSDDLGMVVPSTSVTAPFTHIILKACCTEQN